MDKKYLRDVGPSYENMESCLIFARIQKKSLVDFSVDSCPSDMFAIFPIQKHIKLYIMFNTDKNFRTS